MVRPSHRGEELSVPGEVPAEETLQYVEKGSECCWGERALGDLVFLFSPSLLYPLLAAFKSDRTQVSSPGHTL